MRNIDLRNLTFDETTGHYRDNNTGQFVKAEIVEAARVQELLERDTDKLEAQAKPSPVQRMYRQVSTHIMNKSMAMLSHNDTCARVNAMINHSVCRLYANGYRVIWIKLAYGEMGDELLMRKETMFESPEETRWPIGKVLEFKFAESMHFPVTTYLEACANVSTLLRYTSCKIFFDYKGERARLLNAVPVLGPLAGNLEATVSTIREGVIVLPMKATATVDFYFI